MFRTHIRFKSSAAPSNADDTVSLVCAVAYDLLSLLLEELRPHPAGPVCSARTPRLYAPRSVKDSGTLSQPQEYPRRLLMQTRKAEN